VAVAPAARHDGTRVADIGLILSLVGVVIGYLRADVSLIVAGVVLAFASSARLQSPRRRSR
jgi:hypothetical protein